MAQQGRPRRKARAEREDVPISVRFPVDLRARAERYARARRMGVATAIRMLVSEHLDQIDRDEELSHAERWQRAQAWATWEKIKAGDRRDVPWETLVEATERALRRIDAKEKRS